MDFVASFIQKHQLPDSFRSVAEAHYLPLCGWVASILEAKKSKSKEPLVLGINGAQGTGKSTLADFIAEYAKPGSDLQVAVVSIDDFYLTKAVRTQLSETVHPLLAIRGVPGTHDLSLAMRVMKQLMSGESAIELPKFDKSIDDRFNQSQWAKIEAPVDLIILEGWCVGSTPESSAALQEPVNGLESTEDESGIWRTYVNDSLSADYQQLFAMLDHLILLKTPDFDAVYRWRLEQEEKLAARINKQDAELTTEQAKVKASGVMNAKQISRFIQHYERLARHNLEVLPEKADKILELDQNHQVV